MGKADAAPFGTRPEDDYPALAQPPSEPSFGENHAFWIFGEDGRIFINTHINSIERYWPLRREIMSVCLPDGRALANQTEGALTSADTVGGGQFTARCVEPFQRWDLRFQGSMIDTTQAALAAGPLSEGNRVLVEWEAEVKPEKALWTQGAMSIGGAQTFTKTDVGRFVGGGRYEQLFRAEVRFHIIGGPEYRFAATGLRTHRCGPRAMGGYIGHDWQTALFPSGDAFGFMRFPTEDGGTAWQEGFVLHRGAMIPATVQSDSWISRRRPAGERWTVRLTSRLGETRVEVEQIGTIFRPILLPDNPRPFDRYFGFHREPQDRAVMMSQGWIRCTMNGETANGLCERSTLARKLD